MIEEIKKRLRKLRNHLTGNLVIRGNVKMGKGSYINSGFIITGPNSKITIGKYCAIGNFVRIRSIDHDPENPYDEKGNHLIEKDIKIGDRVWIGDGVLIKMGVTLGNDCVVGANAVVTKSFPDKCIIGGVPARLIRKKK